MESQTKVQGYLNKHKIGNLFEALMSSLVKELPADPHAFIISVVQERKQKQQQRSGMLESSDTKSSTSVWASTDHDDFDKSVKTKVKKTDAKRQSVEAPQPFSRREWDKTVKITSKSFDEFKRATKKSPQDSKTRAKSSDIFNDNHLGERNSMMTEEEFMANELSNAIKTDNSKDDSQEIIEHRLHPKLKGPKADTLRHQKELAAFINSKKSDSGISVSSNDSDDNEADSANILAENSEDLAAEGVKISPNSSQQQIRKPTPYSEPVLSVSICANCAKVLHGGVTDRTSSVVSSTSVSTQKSSRNNQPADSTARTNLSSEWRTHRTDPLNVPNKNPQMKQRNRAPLDTNRSPQPLTNRDHLVTERTGFSSYYAVEDDEFESVSQVSGEKPRVPIWHDSDDEDIAPVKGSHMLTSPRLSKPATTNSNKKKMTVTLKEDLLRQLPQSSNTVEEFLGNKTWSGEKVNVRRAGKVRRSVEWDATVSQSRDTLKGTSSPGWKFEVDSEDESTVH